VFDRPDAGILRHAHRARRIGVHLDVGLPVIGGKIIAPEGQMRGPTIWPSSMARLRPKTLTPTLPLSRAACGTAYESG